MDIKKVNQIIRIAKMYYEMNLDQKEIAKRENISKSTVSRLLTVAREQNFVKITIEKPSLFMSDMEDKIKERYGLRKVVITPCIVEDAKVNFHDVCNSVAQDLGEYVANNSILATAWGETLNEVANNLTPMIRNGVKVVQANGGISRIIKDRGNDRIISRLCEALDAEGYLIPAPVIVDSIPCAEHLKQDSQIREVFEMVENADVGLWSVGCVTTDSLLYEFAQFRGDSFSKLKEIAVCDVCSHYLNKDGEIADPVLDARIISTDPDKLRAIPTKIVVASGIKKEKPLRVALKSGFCDILYIDEQLAKKILDFPKQDKRYVKTY